MTRKHATFLESLTRRSSRGRSLGVSDAPHCEGVAALGREHSAVLRRIPRQVLRQNAPDSFTPACARHVSNATY